MWQRIFPKILTSGWSVFVLALLIRWGVFYYHYFVFKTPGGIPPSPHANEVYDLLARSLLNGQGLTLWYFAYRPPLYSMFIAVVYSLFNTTHPLSAVFAQSFISAAICPLAYHLAKELGATVKVQWLAGLLTALDPASITINLVLMAETLSNLFIALTLIFLVRLLKGGRRRDIAASAASAILAALARPNAIYFFVVVALIIVIGLPRKRIWAALFVCLFGLGVAPWYLRNYTYAQVATFATTSDFNLLFYKGVSVEQWATGKSPASIQAELTYELERRLGQSRPRSSYDENSMWPYLVPNDTRAYRLMREMALEIYRAHPLTYVLLIPVTLLKLLGFNGLPDLRDPLTDLTWIYNIGLYSLSSIGCLSELKKKSWLGLTITLMPIVYFLLVPALTGGVQDTRARTNVTICFAILAAEGFEPLKNWRPRSLKSHAPNHLPRP